MSIFAYALSDYVQSAYDSPLDLCQRSLVPANADGFNANPLWYAVSFPQWEGYRVVHDPVYTAYTYVEVTEGEDETEFEPAGLVILVLIVGVVVLAIVALATRKK
jgi:hypothetical protein